MSANVRGNTIGSVPSGAPQADDWSGWRNAWIQLADAVNFLLRGGRGITLNTSVGDAAYSILASDQTIETSVAFTAPRIWTLPAANSVDAGYEISIIDAKPAITSTNTLTIALSGTDTIDGSTRSLVLTVAGSAITLISDGLANWGAKDELGSISTGIAVNLNTAGAPVLPVVFQGQMVGVDSASNSGWASLGIAANPAYVCVRGNGTLAVPTALAAGNLIGVYGSGGRGTAAWHMGTGGIAIWARQNWTDTANGSYVSVDTLSNGTTGAAIHRMHWYDGVTIQDSAGNDPAGGDKGAGTLNMPGPLYISANTTTAPTLPITFLEQITGADSAGNAGVSSVGIANNPAYVCVRGNGTLAGLSALAAGNLIGVYGTGGRGTANWHIGTGGMAVWAKENWTDAANGTFISLDTLSTGTTGAAVHRLTVYDGITINDGFGADPTGGDKGSGTVNVAAGYYVNGSKGATYQATPANPTGTTSLTGVMMGLAGSITPKTTGTVVVIISGVASNDTNGDGFKVQIRFGTGSAPANGGALAGTVAGAEQGVILPTANDGVVFSCNALVTGGAIGTAYWLDVDLLAVTGGTASIQRVSITAFELTV